MARTQIIESQVRDTDFLSPAEHENETNHYFRDLADATTYSGVDAGGKYVRVKDDETGLEYATVSGTGGAGASTLLELTDTPATYSGTTGQYLMSTGSGTEWSTVSGVGLNIYTEARPPEDVDGLPGDFFIDTLNNTIYEKVSAAAAQITAKSVIFDIADNHTDSDFTGIRSVEFYLGDTLLEFEDADITCYETTKYATSRWAKYAFITGLSKTGGASNTSWLSASGATRFNQRIICVFNDAQTFDKIVINNEHGSNTAGGGHTDRGAKNTVITTSTDAISSTVYDSAISNSSVIFDGQITQHVASDVIDDEILTLTLGVGTSASWEIALITKDTFLELTDTPSTYSGTDGYLLASTGSGTEWTEGDFADTSHTHTEYVLVDGTRGFIDTVSGVTPTEDYHLADKSYVDDRFAEEIFWDRVGTDVRLLTPSNTMSLGTTVTGTAQLNVFEEVYIHELTGGTAYLTLNAAVANEGGEAFINFQDEGQTVGLFRVGVEQIQFSAYSEYDMELLLETAAHSGGTTDVTIQTGNATAGNSGDVNLTTGTAGGTRGNVVVGTHLMPEMTGASGTVSVRNIGGPSDKFQYIYVHDAYIDAGSLYINNKKVIEDVSDTINITTDADQDLKVKTTGTGDLLLQTENEINANSEGGVEFNVLSTNSTKHLNFTNQSANGNITFSADGANAQVQFSATDEIDLTSPTVDINGNADVSGEITFGTLHHHNLTGVGDDDHTQYVLADGTRNITGNIFMTDGAVIHGDLTVSGTTFHTQHETVEIVDNLLLINEGEVGPGVTVSGGHAGIEVDRGSSANYRFVFDEVNDNFKVGETGDLQPVATREALPTANGVAYWDSVNYRFITMANMTFDGDLKLTDNTKIYFGDDDDLNIYHTGSYGGLDNNTGGLYIDGASGSDIWFRIGSSLAMKILADQDVVFENDILQGDDDSHYFGSSNDGEITWSPGTTTFYVQTLSTSGLEYYAIYNQSTHANGLMAIRNYGGGGLYLDNENASGSIYLRTGTTPTAALTIGATQNAAFAGNIYLPDAKTTVYGDSYEGKVSWNGSNFLIQNQVSGSVYIDGYSNAYIRTGSSPTIALTINSSQVATFVNFPITPSSAPTTDYQLSLIHI